MHEFGLCEGVLDAVRKRAAGRQVAAIRIRCGVRHAVDEASMAHAFSVVAEGTEAAGAIVDVVTVPAAITCRDCGATGESTDRLSACQACGSVNVELDGGDELTLESLSYAPANDAADNTADGTETIRRFELRSEATRQLAGQASAVAAACHAMAVRFHQGGKLVAFGAGGPSTDAQHVAVEFVHPVIVGKRALPAISLTTDVATVTAIAEREGVDAIFSRQLPYVAAPSDIALGISTDGNSASVLAGLETAAGIGLLTVALVGGTDGGGRIAAAKAADHLLVAASDDPRIVKEIHVTTYHILWELVHVFFEQPGVLAPGVVA
ncbi:MAG TPA: hydrogenase/urease maturation nickel metallochaperone HypA [Trebonia sp.]|jgi:D-sedoheptulose 7-phosphate isomerase|nr:hydrogenase/urease maturation nickel metallochaperone HypA [Trebonia sp.]